MKDIANCSLCELPKTLKAISLDTDWTLNAARDALDRPWLVLQTKRHVKSVDLLNNQEAASLGFHIQNISSHLMRLTQAKQIHVYQMNEANPGHVHFHFLPSFDSDEFQPRTLLDLPLPSKVIPFQKSDWLPNQTPTSQHEPSFTVRTLVQISKGIKALNFIYPLIQKFCARVGIDRGYAAEILVTSSLCLWITSFFLIENAESPILLGVSALGLLRILDINATQISIILDRNARILKSFERSLVLAFLNLTEIIFVSSIWNRAITSENRLSSFASSFQVATNRGEFSETSRLLLLVDVSVTISSVLILFIVVATVLGRISSERFDESK